MSELNISDTGLHAFDVCESIDNYTIEIEKVLYRARTTQNYDCVVFIPSLELIHPYINAGNPGSVAVSIEAYNALALNPYDPIEANLVELDHFQTHGFPRP